MEALIQELKNSIEEPNSSLLEEVQHEFSQQIHTPICFHECQELVKPNTKKFDEFRENKKVYDVDLKLFGDCELVVQMYFHQI